MMLAFYDRWNESLDNFEEVSPDIVTKLDGKHMVWMQVLTVTQGYGALVGLSKKKYDAMPDDADLASFHLKWYPLAFTTSAEWRLVKCTLSTSRSVIERRVPRVKPYSRFTDIRINDCDDFEMVHIPWFKYKDLTKKIDEAFVRNIKHQFDLSRPNVLAHPRADIGSLDEVRVSSEDEYKACLAMNSISDGNEHGSYFTRDAILSRDIQSDISPLGHDYSTFPFPFASVAPFTTCSQYAYDHQFLITDIILCSNLNDAYRVSEHIIPVARRMLQPDAFEILEWSLSIDWLTFLYDTTLITILPQVIGQIIIEYCRQ
jgi:hypothetical protein